MTATLSTVKTLIAQADDIAAAHEQFNTQYVIGGRMALYTLIGDMLRVVNSFEAAVDRQDLLKIIKQRLRGEFGIKVQKNSGDIAVLVRYMTRADRKTAHVYTRVIEAAKLNAVTPEQLPTFIEGAGGVERIRALGANTTESVAEDDAAERVSLTEEYLSCRAELPLASFEATEFLDKFSSNSAAYAYFACTRKGDGRFHVLSPMPATAEFERIAIRHLSELVCRDMAAARQGVASLRRRANDVIKARRAVEITKPNTDESANLTKDN